MTVHLVTGTDHEVTREQDYNGQRDDSHPRQKRAGWVRFRLAAQNDGQLKTYESFISGIFHLIFSEHS